MAREPFKSTVAGIIALGVISGVIANQFGVLHIRAWLKSESMRPSGANAATPPIPTPLPTPPATPVPTPPATADPMTTPTPNIFTFQIASDSGIAFHDKGIQISTSYFRLINEYTAVTLKIEAQAAVTLHREPHNDTLQNTHIIDDEGRRFELLYEDSSSPRDRINWGVDGSYRMEKGEIVYLTNFFRGVPKSIRWVNIYFSLLNSSQVSQSPYLHLEFQPDGFDFAHWIVVIPSINKNATYKVDGVFGTLDGLNSSDSVGYLSVAQAQYFYYHHIDAVGLKLVSLEDKKCYSAPSVPIVMNVAKKTFRAIASEQLIPACWSRATAQ